MRLATWWSWALGQKQELSRHGMEEGWSLEIENKKLQWRGGVWIEEKWRRKESLNEKVTSRWTKIDQLKFMWCMLMLWVKDMEGRLFKQIQEKLWNFNETNWVVWWADLPALFGWLAVEKESQPGIEAPERGVGWDRSVQDKSSLRSSAKKMSLSKRIAKEDKEFWHRKMSSKESIYSKQIFLVGVLLWLHPLQGLDFCV